VSYGTDNVISDRDAGDRMRFDPVIRVIRAGEIGMFLHEFLYREISTRRERRKGKKSSPVLENRVHSFKIIKIIILDGLEIKLVRLIDRQANIVGIFFLVYPSLSPIRA